MASAAVECVVTRVSDDDIRAYMARDAVVPRAAHNLQDSAQAQPKRGQRPSTPSLLTGRIFDSNGNRMSPTHANKRGVRYRYYTSRALAEGRKNESGTPARVCAPEIEKAVIAAVRQHISDLERQKGTPAAQLLTEQRESTKHLATSSSEPRNDAALIADFLGRIDVYADRFELEIKGDFQPDRVPHLPLEGHDTCEAIKAQPAHLTLTVPWSPAHHKPRHLIVEGAPAEAGSSSVQDNGSCLHLAHAIVTGRCWLAELASGTAQSIDIIARREAKHVRTIRTTIALAFLAPDMIAQMIAEGLPANWTLTDVARRLPKQWTDQRKMFAG